MNAPVTSRLLRAIATHPEPLTLARPPGNRESPARAAATRPRLAVDEPSPEAVRALHDRAQADGFAFGCEEGRRAGIEKGMAEADARIQEAMTLAQAQGRDEAVRRDELARKAWAEQVREMADLRRAFESAAEARIESLERDAVALAFEALCRIVGETAEQPAHLARLVRTSMAQLRGAGLLRVRLHPRDLERLRQVADGIELTMPSDVVRWLPDPAVLPGGCVFDSDAGSLDARLETQLARLRDAWSAAADSWDPVSSGGPP